MRYFIFLFFPFLVFGKSFVGLINIQSNDNNLKEQAVLITEYLSLKMKAQLESTGEYELKTNKLDFDELSITSGCSETDKEKCMFKIADLMKVDHLVFGDIVKRDSETYILRLKKIFYSKADPSRNTLITTLPIIGRLDKDNTDYYSQVDAVVMKMFPEIKITKKVLEANPLLDIKVIDSKTSEPITAEIYFDSLDNKVANSPVILKDDKFSPGEHVIYIKAKNYDTAQRRVTLNPQRALAISVTLNELKNPALSKSGDEKLNLTKDEKLSSSEYAWYKDWKVYLGIGAGVAVVVTTVVVVALLNRDTENHSILTVY